MTQESVHGSAHSGRSLREIFDDHEGRRIDKWLHYFEVYEAHFTRFRGQAVTVVEVGVSQGGSLQMWREFFGAEARIIGIDIDERCRVMEEEGFEIYIGSQEDRGFWNSVLESVGPITVFIDDGGHRMRQQIVTFECVYSHVVDGGVYLCEDTHTSYWITYGGGVRRRGTFMERAKRLVDELQGYHSEQHKRLPVSEFTRTTKSLHFYDSIVVIEKGRRTQPEKENRGSESFHRVGWDGYKDQSLKARSKRFVLYSINSSLRYFKLGGYKWR